MIKTFRSSDKKGTEGIDFGEEWYKRLMVQLQSTTDVVCLFTERSLDRPWILFEAGVAKGKLDTPVVGVALGVSLTRVSAGPFYQFMNMDDSEADLVKLVNQLARRVPGVELDADVVKSQVTTFKNTEAELLKKLPTSKALAKDETEENAVSKLAEELKSLPSRVAERLSETMEPARKRRLRRVHPMMLDELMHNMGSKNGDPLAILIAASLIKEDIPWLYELAMEVYRAIKTGSRDEIEREIKRISYISDGAFSGPFFEEVMMNGDRETYVFMREFPRMLERFLAMSLAIRSDRPSSIRKASMDSSLDKRQPK
jgi:hypothetical protein